MQSHFLFATLALSLPLIAQAPAAETMPLPLVETIEAFPNQAGFENPLLVEFTATDPEHAYVVAQSGQIFRVPRNPAAKERSLFVDLASKVYYGENWEEGLLGFAFDPDYAQNGLVYVCYSEKTPLQQGEMAPALDQLAAKKAKSTRQSVVARFGTRLDGEVRVIDVATELRLMIVFQPWGNHNGGTIVFGPDRMLYIALGDGGAARDPFGNGQDKRTLLGKVLRIDVRGATAEKPYAIPSDNPFVGEVGTRGEIWCYGMRNPWRITFDRVSGDLWCADVGQDRVEEVDRLVKGGNYGWNLMEANEVFKKNATIPADLIAPIASYPHAEGLSVTGGYVYRGKAMPQLDGCYVYGDFSSMRLWAVKEDRAGGKHVVQEIGRAAGPLSSFAEEPDGELLVTCFNNKTNGKVYRLVPRPKSGE